MTVTFADLDRARAVVEAARIQVRNVRRYPGKYIPGKDAKALRVFNQALADFHRVYTQAYEDKL